MITLKKSAIEKGTIRVSEQYISNGHWLIHRTLVKNEEDFRPETVIKKWDGLVMTENLAHKVIPDPTEAQRQDPFVWTRIVRVTKQGQELL